MKVLLVSSFAPYRDGIASYALQELRDLRQNGDEVEVLSPLPSAAKHHVRLGSARSWASVVPLASRFDRVIIQLAPDLLFGRCRNGVERAAVWSTLVAVAQVTKLDLRVHELQTDALAANAIERRAAALALAAADRVTVHTEAERDALLGAVGTGRIGVELVDHGRFFQPRKTLTQAEAKEALGITPAEIPLVAIGFLQRHKGFDRAIEALARAAGIGAVAASRQAHLHIVGSARIDHPEIARYVAELRQLCHARPDVTLHEGFVSDDDFDVWLQASSAVILPYRQIWSSGVLERARLFGRQVIASDLPELRDQAPVGTLLCSSIDEFAVAIEKVAEAERSALDLPIAPQAPVEPVAAWETDPGNPDRASIEKQIATKARRFELEVAAVGSGAGPRGEDDAAIGDRAIDALLALGALERPAAVSARPGVSQAKHAIKRATDWQIDPVARQIEALHRATIEAVGALEAEIASRARASDRTQPGDSPTGGEQAKVVSTSIGGSGKTEPTGGTVKRSEEI